MPTTVRLDDNRVLQLVRNTKLWPHFPLFKNLALKAQSAETRIGSGRTGCSSCAARKRSMGQVKLADTISSAKEAIIGMSKEDKEKLKKALGADYIRVITTGENGKPKELMY